MKHDTKSLRTCVRCPLAAAFDRTTAIASIHGMKPVTLKGLLTLVVTFSTGRVGSGFVAPTTSAVSSSGRERKGHASSATALQDTTSTATSQGQEVLDFAIVGGGPAGLAAAVGLKEKGLAVKVFEAAPEITERGAAVFLQVCRVSRLLVVRLLTPHEVLVLITAVGQSHTSG